MKWQERQDVVWIRRTDIGVHCRMKVCGLALRDQPVKELDRIGKLSIRSRHTTCREIDRGRRAPKTRVLEHGSRERTDRVALPSDDLGSGQQVTAFGIEERAPGVVEDSGELRRAGLKAQQGVEPRMSHVLSEAAGPPEVNSRE
jgi:hypothetical protein